jgi:beta-phosphoglucomutase-like phosphatase (HAD superfamily)
MALKAVIFGVDGVLAETHEARREAYNIVFAEAGLNWRWGRTVYRELLKDSTDGNLIGCFINSRLTDWRQTEDATLLLGAMKRRHVSVYQDLIERAMVKLRPGLGEIIEEALQRGMTLAIATGEARRHIEALLEANLDDPGCITIAASGDESPASDPHTRHRHALGKLNLEPRECLAIDSCPTGIGSALAASIPTVLTWGTYCRLEECSSALDAAGADRLTSSMVMPAWNQSEAGQVLDRLKQYHEFQIGHRTSNGAASPSAHIERELDHAGI